jgi:hypothetical protein
MWPGMLHKTEVYELSTLFTTVGRIIVLSFMEWSKYVYNRGDGRNLGSQTYT